MEILTVPEVARRLGVGEDSVRRLIAEGGSEGRWAARDGACVVCGTTQRLEVHHVDGNPKNDRLSNLEVRCAKHNPRGGRVRF